MITLTPDQKKERERNAAMEAGEIAAERGEPCEPKSYTESRYYKCEYPEEASAAYAQAYERIVQEIARLKPITTFTRKLRDCQHNKDIAAGKKGQLLYNWRVEIDGEHVATFGSYGGSRLNGDRFTLSDREGQPVRAQYRNGEAWNTHVVGARKKDEMLGVLARYLDIIPTPAQIAERHAEIARKRAESIAKEKAEATRSVMTENAAAMYEALELTGVGKPLLQKIDEQIAEWHAAIDRGEH